MSKELSQRLDACAADIINGEIQYSDKVVGLLMEASEALSHLPDREEVAKIISGAPFPSKRSLDKADRILSLMERKA